MGYTHISTSTAVAIATAVVMGSDSLAVYLTAAAAGAVGGVIIDADSRDRFSYPKMTDAGRSKLSALGLLLLCVIIDLVYGTNNLSTIISRQLLPIIGLVILAVMFIVGSHSDHRTITHSLLFIVLTSMGVALIYPQATVFYSIGCVVHLLLDMLNYPFHGHGIWLLYPIIKGKGIALKLCKSSKTGNKTAYFIGLIGCIVVSGLFAYKSSNPIYYIPTIIIVAYLVIVLHFVRTKTEKELISK